MPIYEYKCSECGHTFEVLARMSDAPPTNCESCGEPGTLEKVLHPAQINYRGSGFYATDYARRKAAPGDGQKKSGGSGSDTAGSGSNSASASVGASDGAGSSAPA